MLKFLTASCSWAFRTALMAMKNNNEDEHIPFTFTSNDDDPIVIAVRPSRLVKWAIDSYQADSVSIHQKDGLGCGMFYPINEFSALALDVKNPYVVSNL